MAEYGLQGDSLLLDVAGGIATVTLNRPQQQNALSRELRDNILRVLVAARADPAVSVLVFTGAGPRAFSVGADLKELETSPLRPEEMGVSSPVMQAFAALDKPTIAAVNGYAVTGGFELVVNCDIILASPAARFADTHARVGIMSAWGLSQYLPRIVGPVRAKYLSLTGNYIDAQTALAWGLVLEVVEPGALLPRCHAIARDIISCDPATVRDLHRAIRQGQHHTLAEGLTFEAGLARASLDRFDPARFGRIRTAVMARGKLEVGRASAGPPE